MPGKGYRSITISEDVYDKFEEIYLENKKKMAKKGINSFSGFFVHKFKSALKADEIFGKYMRKIEVLHFDSDQIILQDNINIKVVIVYIRNKKLECSICSSGSCIHVGFCYSLFKIYPYLEKEKKKK